MIFLKTFSSCCSCSTEWTD